MVPAFLFAWLKQRRRRKTLQNPIPKAWDAILSLNLRHFENLSPPQRDRLRDFVHIFVTEKNWEGCGGLPMTPEIQVTIAGMVGILVIGQPQHQFFDHVLSILVYPEPYQGPIQVAAGSGIVLESYSARQGEAWYRGPVILAWNEVLADAHGHRPGHNLVVHEFAHQLDMLNGRHADGIPPLESRETRERWITNLTREHQRLVNETQQGTNWIDDYAATNRSEFFAVTSELFFEEPWEMAWRHPDWFECLLDFYQVDPRKWVPKY